MGYDTNFSLRLYSRSEEAALSGETAAAVFADIEKTSGYKLEDKDPAGGCADLYETHWYDWARDLAEVSRRFPDVIIEVTGEGEDRDDNWKARFLGGKSETVGQETGFPPFHTILTPAERKPSAEPRRDVTPGELGTYRRDRAVFSRRCRDQFIRTLRQAAAAATGLPEGRIAIGPDSAFPAFRVRKDCDRYAVTVLAVGTDGLGTPVFDIRGMYQEEKGVPLADDRSYGVMIEDWPSALEELLLHLEDTGTPGGDQGPYTD